MKKFISLTLALLLSIMTVQAQTIIYKADKWGNTKLYHDWAKGLDNPILEKVVIKQTPKTITVTFGKRKPKSYKIIKSENINPTATKYYVESNNENYVIKVMFIANKYYFICEKEWAVADITNMSTSD